jgi:SPASM domain peptide maturase of grasp-with-spasm system
MKLILFNSVVLTKGIKRSIIIDLQRKEYHFIPNSFYDLLITNKDLTFEKLVEKYGSENKNILKEYLSFLTDNDLVFSTNISEQFIELSTDFEIPSIISNTIIEFNEKIDYTSTIKELSEANCKVIELRINKLIEKEAFLKFLEICLTISRLQSLIIYIPDEIFTLNELKQLCFKYQFISSYHVHSSLKQKTFFIEGVGVYVFYTKKKYINNHQCGEINKNNFIVNNEFYFETQNYNNCLHKKISIDIKGNIKNCPSMVKSFGNIFENSILEIVNTDEFKILWNINKNKIETCKICEFRDICMDCRAFLTKDEKFNKPKKCNYNQYSALWEK